MIFYVVFVNCNRYAVQNFTHELIHDKIKMSNNIDLLQPTFAFQVAYKTTRLFSFVDFFPRGHTSE